METTEHAVNYCAAAYAREHGVALVLGNEQIGVDTEVLAAVDGTVEIPTFGLKNSLNVASAGGSTAPSAALGTGVDRGLRDGGPPRAAH